MGKEGVYLLCSRNVDGHFVYKVGRSKNVESRIKTGYPPNFEILLTIITEYSVNVERDVLKIFSEIPELNRYGEKREFFSSPKNMHDSLKQIILNENEKNIYKALRTEIETSLARSPVIRGQLIKKNPISLLRCTTDDMCEDFLLFITGNDEARVKLIKEIYDVSCNHHWYYILFEERLIGYVILACGHRPRDELSIFAMEVNSQVKRLGIGTKVLQMVEREFFWNKKRMEVSEMFYDQAPEFLKKNGFIFNVKLRDLNNVKDTDSCKTHDVTFRWKEVDGAGENEKSEDQIIPCIVSIWSHSESKVYEFNVQLLKTWVQPTSDYDGELSLLVEDKYILESVRFKYLLKENEDKCRFERTDVAMSWIARADNIFIYDKGLLVYAKDPINKAGCRDETTKSSSD